MLSLKSIKLGIAPGYDMHPEFFKHLSQSGLTWLATFFTRIVTEQRMPKVWRRTKVIALAQPGKHPQLPSSYRPISQLSVCFKLLERAVLQRIYHMRLMGYLLEIEHASDAAAAHAIKLLHSPHI